MSFINKKDKKPFLLDFSEAVEYFYDIGVEDILTFKTWEDGPSNARFTNYHIDFSTVGGDPGTVYLARMENNKPIFEMSHLCEDLVINMMGYEFEIIRPFIINSMTDIVNRYRTLLKIYNDLRSSKSIQLSHPFYIKFLISRLRYYQNSIEEAAIAIIDRKELNKGGSVEGLLPIKIEDRFPVIRDVKSVNEKLVENILMN